MLDALREHGGRGTDDAREISGRVDDRVPRTPLERAQISVAVAAKPLDAGEEIRLVATAVEERHLVPARERRVDDVSPDENRAAENE